MLKKTLMFLLLCSLISSVAYAETHNVTRSEALEIAQRQFEGRDVDYYYLDGNPVEFVIFVDAQPMMNWEHECYIYYLYRLCECMTCTKHIIL